MQPRPLIVIVRVGDADVEVVAQLADGQRTTRSMRQHHEFVMVFARDQVVSMRVTSTGCIKDDVWGHPAEVRGGMVIHDGDTFNVWLNDVSWWWPTNPLADTPRQGYGLHLSTNANQKGHQ